MSFPEWQKNGWVRPHRASRQEIEGLLGVIERDLKASANPQLDDDWRFAIAYNAALQCAALAMKAAGYEALKGGGAHHRIIESLKITLKDDGTIVDPLQKFRAKRGGGLYETTGIASVTEIDELWQLANALRAKVLERLKVHFPQLAPARVPTPGRRTRGN
jgi:hypothetical protein